MRTVIVGHQHIVFERMRTVHEHNGIEGVDG